MSDRLKILLVWACEDKTGFLEALQAKEGRCGHLAYKVALGLGKDPTPLWHSSLDGQAELKNDIITFDPGTKTV